MIVDDVRCDERADRIERSARVRRGGRDGRELRVSFEVPAVDGHALRRDVDGSPFLAATVLAAMIEGEDLHIDAPVSPLLRHQIDDIVTAYALWDPTLRPPTIDDAGDTAPAAPGAAVGAFFSRGADSMVTAAVERAAPLTLTHLVFCDGFEPRHSRATADEEIRLAGEAAGRCGLPLVVVRTNVRELTQQRRDWADAHGGALGAVALALDGVFGSMVIPSTNAFDELVPFGSSPALDPLYSSESVAVRHDSVALSRAGKVWFLAQQRPDLLPLLKVCFAEDRPDNCGRCGKCIITMAALQAAGALHLATAFPDEIPLDDLRAIRPVPLASRRHWIAVMRVLGDRGANGDLRAEIGRSLRLSARPDWRKRVEHLRAFVRRERPTLDPNWRDPTRGFDWRHHTETLRVLRRGRPDWPIADEPQPPLVRARARPAVDIAHEELTA